MSNHHHGHERQQADAGTTEAHRPAIENLAPPHEVTADTLRDTTCEGEAGVGDDDLPAPSATDRGEAGAMTRATRRRSDRGKVGEHNPRRLRLFTPTIEDLRIELETLARRDEEFRYLAEKALVQIAQLECDEGESYSAMKRLRQAVFDARSAATLGQRHLWRDAHTMAIRLEIAARARLAD